MKRAMARAGGMFLLALGLAMSFAGPAMAATISESAAATADVDITVSATVQGAVKISVTHANLAGAADSGTMDFGNVDAICVATGQAWLTRTEGTDYCDYTTTTDLSVETKWAPEATARAVNTCQGVGGSNALMGISDDLTGTPQYIDPTANLCTAAKVALGSTGVASPRTDNLTFGVRVRDTDAAGATTTVLVYEIAP